MIGGVWKHKFPPLAHTYQIARCRRHAQIQCLPLTGKILYFECGNKNNGELNHNKMNMHECKIKRYNKKPVHQIQQTSFVFLSYLLAHVFSVPTYYVKCEIEIIIIIITICTYVLITTRARSRHS